jgi:GTP-binding protein
MKHAHLFVDEAQLEVQSGSGGDGNVSFRREKYIPNGGPNGGDGGRGGDIVLVADTNVATLLDLKSARRIKAADGEPGGGNDKKGASGEPVEIRVPVGTLVYEIESLPVARSASRHIGTYTGAARGEPAPDGEEEPEILEGDDASDLIEIERWEEDEPEDLGTIPLETPRLTTPDGEPVPTADLTRHGQRIVIARGGRGGLGNARFKTSTRQAPDFATPGKTGQLKRIQLSLKLMADVGLVGFPNAGKSTLLRRISAAKPRVANYPFTTLVPSLGVVERGEQRCVVADIPGLIEGASEGAGLGHQFLRHVERTRVLIHLLDVEAMLMQGRDLQADYVAIRRELERYRPELLERHEIVVLNKCDLLHDPAQLAELEVRLAKQGLDPLRISGATNLGIDKLLARMFEAVDRARREEAAREEDETKEA